MIFPGESSSRFSDSFMSDEDILSPVRGASRGTRKPLTRKRGVAATRNYTKTQQGSNRVVFSCVGPKGPNLSRVTRLGEKKQNIFSPSPIPHPSSLHFTQ